MKRVIIATKDTADKRKLKDFSIGEQNQIFDVVKRVKIRMEDEISSRFEGFSVTVEPYLSTTGKTFLFPIKAYHDGDVIAQEEAKIGVTFCQNENMLYKKLQRTFAYKFVLAHIDTFEDSLAIRNALETSDAGRIFKQVYNIPCDVKLDEVNTFINNYSKPGTYPNMVLRFELSNYYDDPSVVARPIYMSLDFGKNWLRTKGSDIDPIKEFRGISAEQIIQNLSEVYDPTGSFNSLMSVLDTAVDYIPDGAILDIHGAFKHDYWVDVFVNGQDVSGYADVPWQELPAKEQKFLDDILKLLDSASKM